MRSFIEWEILQKGIDKMKNMAKKALSIFLCIVLCAGMLPPVAHAAEDETEASLAWSEMASAEAVSGEASVEALTDAAEPEAEPPSAEADATQGQTQSVTFINEYGREQTVSAYMLSDGDFSVEAQYIAVSGSVTLNNGLSIYYGKGGSSNSTGSAVYLILCDGAELTLSAGGIKIYPGDHIISGGTCRMTLNICAQAEGTGKLNVSTASRYYGVGISTAYGNNLNVYGGDITLQGGGMGSDGIGITREGEDDGYALGKVIISGGTVRTSGGGIRNGISASAVEVKGGTLIASGGVKMISAGSGIAATGSVSVSGGDVTATGLNGVSCDSLTVRAGDITANAITDGNYGIKANTAMISGGEVAATGLDGINGKTITISGGTVEAEAVPNGSLASRGIYAGEKLTLTGGTVRVAGAVQSETIELGYTSVDGASYTADSWTGTVSLSKPFRYADTGEAAALPLQGGRTIIPMIPSGGSCGENVTWSFDEASGVLFISGTGKMMT